MAVAVPTADPTVRAPAHVFVSDPICFEHFCTFPDRGRSVLIFTLVPCRAALKGDEKISFNRCWSFLLWQNASPKDAAEEPGSEPLATATTRLQAPLGRATAAWKELNKFFNFSFKV
jgi:hypothetical protein